MRNKYYAKQLLLSFFFDYFVFLDCHLIIEYNKKYREKSMSPRQILFKPNSVVYFKGDKADNVYVLKSGRIILSYTDIETGEERKEGLQKGEFFGVKSCLGRYLREEDAIVSAESIVLQLALPEFEKLVTGNIKILLKMLNVFSNQLRRVGRSVQNLLSNQVVDNPQKALFNIGEYYFRNRKYTQALYAYRKYLEYYTESSNSKLAYERIKKAEELYSQFGQEQGPAPVSESKTRPSVKTAAAQPQQQSDVSKKYFEGITLESKEQFKSALGVFQAIVDDGKEKEFVLKSKFEIGKCLFFLNQYESCIKHFSAFVKNEPEYGDVNDALFFIGKSYEMHGDKKSAKNIFQKIINDTVPADVIYRKVKKALNSL